MVEEKYKQLKTDGWKNISVITSKKEVRDQINQIIKNIEVGESVHLDLVVKGDKVMQLCNERDDDGKILVANGSVGFVTEIMNNDYFRVEFDTEVDQTYESSYGYYPDKLQVGYAATVHKFQGSEDECIIIVVDPDDRFISRRMLYTAITRGKKKVILISTKAAVNRAVRNEKDRKRQTFLRRVLMRK